MCNHIVLYRTELHCIISQRPYHIKSYQVYILACVVRRFGEKHLQNEIVGTVLH